MSPIWNFFFHVIILSWAIIFGYAAWMGRKFHLDIANTLSLVILSVLCLVCAFTINLPL